MLSLFPKDSQVYEFECVRPANCDRQYMAISSTRPKFRKRFASSFFAVLHVLSNIRRHTPVANDSYEQGEAKRGTRRASCFPTQHDIFQLLQVVIAPSILNYICTYYIGREKIEIPKAFGDDRRKSMLFNFLLEKLINCDS